MLLCKYSHRLSCHTPHHLWKFHANWSSRFLIILLTKKQRKKERKIHTYIQTNKEIDWKQYPIPQRIGDGVIMRAGSHINECLGAPTWDFVTFPKSLTGSPALKFVGTQRHLVGPHRIGLVQLQPALFLTSVFNPPPSQDLCYRGIKNNDNISGLI